jgi:hypothetical protein
MAKKNAPAAAIREYLDINCPRVAHKRGGPGDTPVITPEIKPAVTPADPAKLAPASQPLKATALKPATVSVI